MARLLPQTMEQSQPSPWFPPPPTTPGPPPWSFPCNDSNPHRGSRQRPGGPSMSTMIGSWRLPLDPNGPGNQFHGTGPSMPGQSILPPAHPPHNQPAEDTFVRELEIILRHEDPRYGQRDRGLQMPENKTRERQGQGPNTPHPQLANTEPPRTTMATFEGDKEDWNTFLSGFERLTKRHQWTMEQQLDRLHESLRGSAARFVSLLPEQTWEDYVLLCEQLKNRFGCRDPPSTSCQKLAEIQQGSKLKEEYTEEVRKLVAWAYPDASHETQDQYAAEAFSRDSATAGWQMAFSTMLRLQWPGWKNLLRSVSTTIGQP